MALSQYLRRQAVASLANADAAKEICDAIDASAAAAAAVDKFEFAMLADQDAGASVLVQLLSADDDAKVLQSITMIARGAFAGVDASNTIVLSIVDEDQNVIVTKTYDNVTVPVDNGANALGTLHATFKQIPAGKTVRVLLVCGATADPPEMAFQFRYR